MDAFTAGVATPTELSGTSRDERFRARPCAETSPASVDAAECDVARQASQLSRASAESHEVPPDAANADEWEMASGTRAALREGNARVE